jgi:hypothetical protein
MSSNSNNTIESSPISSSSLSTPSQAPTLPTEQSTPTPTPEESTPEESTPTPEEPTPTPTLEEPTPTPTPEEPTPTPEEPTPTPEEPTPTPEEPTPEEPTPTPEEPTPTPEEPIPTPEEPIPTPEEPDDLELTPEELQELDELEKSLRSKILNKPPPCQKKQPSNPQYIEKVQVKTPLTQTEEIISKIIKSQKDIHPFLYFQPLIQSSPLSVGSVTDCEIPDESVQTNQSQSKLIETKYKKTTTQTFVQFLESQYKQTQKQKNKFIQILVNSHLQLLHAINLLQTIDPPIVHFHITPQTLLYNEIDATPVLTDFRLSFTKTTLDKEESDELFPTYNNYTEWPFEIYLLSHIIENPNNTNDQLEEIANSYADMTRLQQLQQPPNTTIYQNKDPQTLKTELKSTYTTWDVFAITQIIYTFMTEHQIPIDQPFMKSYNDLLLSYLTAEPKQRPTITQLQQNIQNIFQSVPKNEYLSFLSSLTDNKSLETK